ncbi:hypothetical protein GmHk_08G023137 [Glycine max]|nr:hypothetical protein GmHk_08G023137 [Glycine max]
MKWKMTRPKKTGQMTYEAAKEIADKIVSHFQLHPLIEDSMVESQCLTWIRFNQKTIRYDVLNGLEEAVSRGKTNPSSIGKHVILPSSFSGGMRYMFLNCQDAMTICKKFGYPNLFITITCNTSWSEISDVVHKKGLMPSDKLDIVCRVFKMKLDELMSDFKKTNIFGKVNAGNDSTIVLNLTSLYSSMYTVEFQKIGIPHALILLWLNGENRLHNESDIDKIISTELPNLDLYPKLSKSVATYMMHGPCGLVNLKSPCMKERKYSKYFPKKFENSTAIDDDGYPCYQRRDMRISVQKNGVTLDNKNDAPCSPMLLMRYEGHINTKYCNKSDSIKYLSKYVTKGPDRATVEIINSKYNTENCTMVDEIKWYYDCKYLSPYEATWRIFAYVIHERWPTVQRLNFHHPNEQLVFLNDDDQINNVVDANAEGDLPPVDFTEVCKPHILVQPP